MPGLEEFITLEEAIRRYRISRDVLAQLIDSGKVKAIRVDGRIAVLDLEIAAVAIQTQAGDDEIVSINEAARRLGIHPGHISAWVAYGWLPVLARGERGAKLISLKRAEALAQLREKYGLRGRRLIPRREEQKLLSSL